MKHLLFSFFLAFVSLIAVAQTTSRDFNEVKRSQKYYYSEITLANAKESKEYATLELIRQINDSIGFTGNHPVAGVKEITRADLSDLKYLEMERANGVRVMAYYPKEAIVGISSKNNVYIAEQKQSEPSVSENQSFIPARIETDNSLPHSPTLPVSVTTGYPDWVIRSIEILKSKTDIETFVQQLSIMQSQHKIKRYGAIDDCRNSDQCLWAIFDASGNLSAFLGTGHEMRKNFLTGSDEVLSEYNKNNYRLIWFQFSK